MKVCRSCGINKDIGEYYAHREMADGHLNICKECIKRNVRNRRLRFPTKVREYDRRRSTNPERILSSRKITKRQRGSVLGYQAAHNAVCRAVRKGSLVKPNKCSLCGNAGRIEAHHSDYSKPLDVIWLCCECHKRAHMGKTVVSHRIRDALRGNELA